MKVKQMMGPLIRFFVKNGILTVFTSVMILFFLYVLLDMSYSGLVEIGMAFLLILSVISAFFAIIYKQGKRLRGEQERLLMVFEHITDGVVILDEGMNIVQYNPAARRLLDLVEGQKQLHFCGICSDESGMGRLCDYDSCFMREREGVPRPVSIKTVRGELRSISLTVSSYLDTDQRKWHIFRVGELEQERREERKRVAKMMTHSILSAQEKERKRISRELHDGIGQSLYSALLQLEVMEGTLEEEDPVLLQRITSLQQQLRSTIEDIRHLSAELRPSVLDDMGLLAALRNDIQSYGDKFGIQVNFSYEGDKSRLPPAVETALYRIAQEALTNAAKYAHTERVDVFLYQTEEEVGLTIKDYGVGFDLERLTRRGVGLYSMAERTEGLGGLFRIDSAPGAGTSITASLPLKKGDAPYGHTGIAGG